MVSIIGMPQFQAPQQGYNFAPLAAGIDTIRDQQNQNRMMQFRKSEADQSRQMQREQMAQNASQFDARMKQSGDQFNQSHSLQNKRLGMAQQSHGMDMASKKAQLRQQFVTGVAGVAQRIEQEPDPARRSQMWQQFMSFDPRIAQNVPREMQGDPVAGARFIMDQARGYQDPMNAQIKDAQLAKLRAAGGPKEPNATVAKIIDRTDQEIMAGQPAIAALEKALSINNQAYAGLFPQTRASLNAGLNPMATPNADATLEFDKLVLGQALSTLKSTFGAAPTEGERQMLIDIQGSVSQPRAVREKILRRALGMAKRRQAQTERKAKMLRSGTYFTPGYNVIDPASGGQPTSAPTTAPSENDPLGIR